MDDARNTTTTARGDEMNDFDPEEEHEFDALSSLLVNVAIIGCILLAYYVKSRRIYHLPESAGAMMIGVVIGGLARLSTNNLALFEFSPELFFFVLLPPIIFEAGYSLKRKDFFQNIGAITLYAMVGTMISTFVIGGLTYYVAKIGLIRDISKQNPMEALLFGALISAVDPVATLSIMGNTELNCDPLLYSLVFGESVLNDAIAISLFKEFLKYYNPDGPDLSEAEIPAALLSFCFVTVLSVLVGIALGLLASFIYKHTTLSDYPNLETSLLFSFCYLCYSTAEALELSGIMAIFFQGIVLSHYNSYNLSPTAHVASEQIFATLATITETVVFLYMGMGVFTGRFENYDILFSVLSLCFCILARFLNIFPLSYIANCCRNRKNRITYKTQYVLWFTGLRGAIAFALSTNMPGPNSDVYATATLTVCIFTTVVCGGFTNTILTKFDMKNSRGYDNSNDEYKSLSFNPSGPSLDRSSLPQIIHKKDYHKGIKKVWKTFDDEVLKEWFGGITTVASPHDDTHSNFELDPTRGKYEMSPLHADDDNEDK